CGCASPGRPTTCQLISGGAMRPIVLGLAALSLSAVGAHAAGSGYHVIDKVAGPDGRWDYVRVDPSHNRVLLTHGGNVMAIGLALVMDHAGGQITLIDPKTHKDAGTIEVGGDLEAAVVDGAGKAYVNVENKNEIAVVDVAKKAVLAHWPLSGCDGPTGLAYDA